MTTRAGVTHDIEIELPTGVKSGFMLGVGEDGRALWRRHTASLTPSAAPPGPASSQTFPPEIRQEIKLRTGHNGVGLLRHVENSGFVGESKGVDTRFADIFIPGPKPIYIDDIDMLEGAGGFNQWTGGVPNGWTDVGPIFNLTQISTPADKVEEGSSSALLLTNGAGQLLRFSGLTAGEYLQCRITATGRVFPQSGNITARFTSNIGSPSATSSTTNQAWETLSVSLDVGTTVMTSLVFELDGGGGTLSYVDDWKVSIEYFVGPPGPYAQMKIAAAETMFMASARTLWKIDANTGLFTAQDLAPSNIKDLELFNDRLYSAIGASNNFESSTDGSTWAANGLTGDDRFADGFAVSHNALGLPILWKWLEPNKLAASTTPLSSGTWMHWRIGDSDTNILDVLPMPDGSILITKEDGVFELGANGIPRNITPSWRLGRFDKQGRGAAAWLGRAYVPSGRSSIWELDTIAVQATQRRVNPATIGSGASIYSGRASRLHGDGSWLHAFLVKPGASNSLSEYMAGAPDAQGNWHWGHLAELDAGQVDYSWLTSDIGVNPRLYFTSRDVVSDDVAVANVTGVPATLANVDNSSAREWAGVANAGASDDVRATWPDESVLATGEASSGTQANEDYADAEAWSDPGNAAASDNAYATVALDKENTGATTPGTAVGAGWNDPTRIFASDDVEASEVVQFSGGSTSFIIGTNFGFSLPADAYVTAIKVAAEGHFDTGDAGNIEISPYWDGNIPSGTSPFVTAMSNVEDTIYDTGERSMAAWGVTAPPVATINGTGFGFALRCKATVPNVTFFIDHVELTVYYRRTLSDGLRVTNFGFSVPAGSTIRGVTATIERKGSAALRAQDNQVRLIVGGALAGTDKALPGTEYPATDTEAVYGGATDLWGLALTRAQIQASNFGLELRVDSDGDEGDVTVSVDHIKLDISYSTDEDSDFLTATGYGLSVPTSATIDGIQVSVERRVSGGSFIDDTVQLLKAGVATGDNKASAQEWPTADAVEIYGGPTDLWGTTWTAAEVTASNFGARLAVNGPIAQTAEVDLIRITVFYTPLGGSELNNRAGYLTVSTVENPRFCDCYVFNRDVTVRTGVLNRFPGWKTAWEEVIVKTTNATNEALGSNGRQIKLRYNIFDGNGFVEVGGSGNNVIDTSPLQTAYFKTASVASVVSEDIEVEVEFEGDEGVPVLEEISVVGTVRPPVVDVFQFTAIVSDFIQARGGQTHELKENQLAVLRGLNTPGWTVTLYDRDGTGHECFVLTDGGVDEQDILDYSDPDAASPSVMQAVALTMFKVPNSDSWPS